MKQVILPSGREAKINEASFAEAMRLKNAVYSAIAGKVDFSLDGSLLKMLLLIDSDVNVQDALFACMQRCMIGNEKVTRDSFEGNFSDYTAMLQALIEVNLLPFLESLLSSPSSEASQQETEKRGGK